MIRNPLDKSLEGFVGGMAEGSVDLGIVESEFDKLRFDVLAFHLVGVRSLLNLFSKISIFDLGINLY